MNDIPKPRSLDEYINKFRDSRDTKTVHTCDIVLQIGPNSPLVKSSRVTMTVCDTEYFVPAMIENEKAQLSDYPLFAVVRLKRFSFTAKGYLVVKEMNVIKSAQTMFPGPKGNPPQLHPVVHSISTGAPPPANGGVASLTPNKAALASNKNIVNQQANQQQQQYKQQQQQQQQQQNNGDDMSYNNITPIESLAPHSQNCTIKAVVRKKSDIKTYSKVGSAGKILNLELIDDSVNYNEIKATIFGKIDNEICERFNDMMQIGGTYLISNFSCKPKVALYNSLTHPCELSFSTNTKVEPCNQAMVAHTKYSFMSIEELQTFDIKDNKEAPTVDLIGYIEDVQPLADLTTKDNRPLRKFTFSISDSSNKGIQVTAFGAQAEKLSADVQNGNVIAIKAAKLSSFNNLSINFNFSSSYEVNPAHLPECSNLVAWVNARGAGQKTDSLSVSTYSGATTESISCTINDLTQNTQETIHYETDKINYKVVGYFSRPSQITMTAMHLIKDTQTPSWFYWGCRKCQKKVDDSLDVCTHCSEPKVRKYRVQMRLTDETTATYVDLLGNVAKNLFQIDADDLYKMEENDRLKHLFNVLSVPYVVTLKVIPPGQQTQTGGQTSTYVKYSVARVEKVDFMKMFQPTYLENHFIMATQQPAAAE
ncbi:hypothetical protein SAMD00019534_091310 [Acytostelium subglobosum LB1]|uniref:hypothetical protein n=1 Tax=Acytostelium subglobosum LB1 TaxID=1410327 RepID=UPI000645169C|nr:hypothetical protein SAMD00019534_091310 [Acytostelium subglobosum LB1]GAM25956.1 hypothetical protein SAMD00019534_091310 [Acytostelium subglobosum LB1]|eukprot:XP_012750999.1 hypothetical protein SAMD00019534_091310 [Acytostelium subglobosum LB1]